MPSVYLLHAAVDLNVCRCEIHNCDCTPMNGVIPQDGHWILFRHLIMCKLDWIEAPPAFGSPSPQRRS
jgi:hypothetical protein